MPLAVLNIPKMKFIPGKGEKKHKKKGMRTEFVSNVHWRAQKAAAGHRCVPQKRAVKFSLPSWPGHHEWVCVCVWVPECRCVDVSVCPCEAEHSVPENTSLIF